MYRRILVAIDDGKMSEAVLGDALGLAKSAAAQVRVVHAVDSPSALPQVWLAELRVDTDALRRVWRQAGLRVLDRADALARQTGVAIETGLLDMDGERVSRVIVDEAARWGADLVVVGTHSRHGLEHLLLGSVAEAVLRTAPCSVLLVRGH